MASPRRIATVTTVALALVLFRAAPAAQAQEQLTAYELEETGWNGLSRLGEIAEEETAGVSQREMVDLARLSAERHPLLLLHPSPSLDAASIAEWIARGGRALVADDAGRASALIERLELALEPPPRTHGAYLLDNPALPVVGAVGDHALSAGASRLLLNHAAALRSPQRPVFAYDDGLGAVYQMQLGDGVAVVVSDPSLFINFMLPHFDNERFARNVLQTLCQGLTECEPVILAPTGRTTGTPSPVGEGDDATEERQGEAPEWATTVNERVGNVRDLEFDERAFLLASVLLMVGVVIFLFAIFPWRKAGDVRAALVPPIPHPRSEFELNVARYRGELRDRSFVLPASILRESFEMVFYPALELSAPRSGDEDADGIRETAAQRFSARYDTESSRGSREKRRRATLKFLRELGRIPERDMLLLDPSVSIRESDLIRLHRKARRILQEMELLQRYESLARRPGTDTRR